jgi:hypothetical protein
MHKIRAAIFLVKVFFYIIWRILISRKWNMLIADIEEPDGNRTQLTYRITNGNYVLEKYTRGHLGEE